MSVDADERELPTPEQVAAALAPFAALLIWLDRGRPRSLCINGHEYHRRQKKHRGRRSRGR